MDAFLSILGSSGDLGTTGSSGGMGNKDADDAAKAMSSAMADMNATNPDGSPLKAKPRQISLSELMQVLQNRGTLGT